MTIPQHLRRWVRPEVLANLLDESGLNCGTCTRFIGKCCTFQPYVANYNLGEKCFSSLGKSIDLQGRNYSSESSSLALPSQNYFPTPLGLLATHRYQQKHRATPEKSRGMDLICSFYDLASGGCTRWTSRPAECAAHFCESTHGERGTKFWNELSVHLNRMEVAVAQMAMVEFGFSPRMIGEQISWLVRPPEKIEAKEIWTDWLGEEKLFYSKCAEWSRNISRDQVEEWVEETVEETSD